MSAPTTLNLEAEVRELLSQKMREFAAFCAEHWTLTEIDMATDMQHEGSEFQRGYNTALTDGMAGALDHWLEEGQ